MSLINDALRRAQTDVDGGRIQDVPAGLSAAHPPRKQKGSFITILTMVLVIGIAAWGISLFFTSADDKEIVAAQIVTVAESPTILDQNSTAPVETDPASAASVEPEVEPSTEVAATQSNPEVAAPTVPVDEIVTETVQSEPVTPITSSVENPANPASVALPAAPPEAATPPSAVEATANSANEVSLSDEITFFLKKMDITAVMGEGRQARIMMGGDIHKAGELINLDLKIRFHGKKGGILYFTDAFGQLYEKKI